MEEMRNKDRYNLDHDVREEASAVEEESMDEQSRLSRVSRNQAKKQAKTKTRTKSTEKPAANKYVSGFRAFGGSVLRYLSYFYSVLKSPLAAMRAADEKSAKYGYVSLLLFTVLFSLGNFIQLRASRERVLGFGVSYPFYEAFFFVLLFAFTFLLISAGSIWVVSKYIIRYPFAFRDVLNRLSVLFVPVTTLTLLWMVFSIPHLIFLTSILSVFGFCYYLFSIYALIESAYKSSSRPLIDLFYCAGIALLIQVAFVGFIWRFISDYLLSSLIPL
ncbi:hypothetical protein ABES80_01335 [Bacillus gobiensis]|uniref:hypothetical protein n=1 Tax=Bacillus gobiensis TaxID=1441095 RepID=UPI003D244775